MRAEHRPEQAEHQLRLLRLSEQVDHSRNALALLLGRDGRVVVLHSLPADIIITATGLTLISLGGVSITVDGKPFESSKTMSYKAMMFRDVPNLASSFGYTNASWTLKADLTCAYVCRLLNHMQKHGYTRTPRLNDHSVKEEP